MSAFLESSQRSPSAHGSRQIYCAVSSEEEARYLTKTLNIPRAHVLNCQDSSFVAEILAEETTKGLGVDVVLTSFEGELLRASSQCVAEYGTLVHIRTRDLTDQENPAVELPQANMSFVSLNLRHTIHQRPEIVARYVRIRRCCPPSPQICTGTILTGDRVSLMQRMMNFYERGFIGLLSHRQAIEAVEISDHLCSLGKAADLAAVMTLMPDNPQELPTEPAAKALRMRSDRAYLLVGDLGICGRAIATWLVERGAQHIVFLFSSGKSGIHEAFELELASMGCTSIWVSGDGARDADVVHAIRSAEIPFAGVFQTTAAPKVRTCDLSMADSKTSDRLNDRLPRNSRIFAGKNGMGRGESRLSAHGIFTAYCSVSSRSPWTFSCCSARRVPLWAKVI